VSKQSSITRGVQHDPSIPESKRASLADWSFARTSHHAKGASHPYPLILCEDKSSRQKRRKSFLSSKSFFGSATASATRVHLPRLKACPLCCMSGTATRKLAERLQAEERRTSKVPEIFVWSARRVLQEDVEHQVVNFLESKSHRDHDNDPFRNTGC